LTSQWGEPSHEVVQVKSVIYPYGIHVVRTITIFRSGSGYVYRVDSGWKAQSDGRFDFSFAVPTDATHPDGRLRPYVIHPGTVKGYFNIQNIRDASADVAPFTGTMDINGFYMLDPGTYKPTPATVSILVSYDQEAVYFDADLELENVVQGQVGGRVPAKKILGFIQITPEGIPITPATFQALLQRQLGSIGGPVDCVMDIGLSGQKFRVSYVESTHPWTPMGSRRPLSRRREVMSCCPKTGRGVWRRTRAAAERSRPCLTVRRLLLSGSDSYARFERAG